MGNTNYNKISTEASKQTEEVVKTPEIEVKEELPAINAYVVCNCERLNVRKDTSLSAKILCVIEAGSEVRKFDEAGEWSLVVTESGIEGFCMSKYLTLKK